MDRRGFIQAMALTAAGLYVPTRTYFFAPESGWEPPMVKGVDLCWVDPGQPRLRMWHRKWKLEGGVWTSNTRYEVEGIIGR